MSVTPFPLSLQPVTPENSIGAFIFYSHVALTRKGITSYSRSFDLQLSLFVASVRKNGSAGWLRDEMLITPTRRLGRQAHHIDQIWQFPKDSRRFTRQPMRLIRTRAIGS